MGMTAELFAPVTMRWIPAADNCREQRAQDCHSKFDEEKRLNSQSRTVTQESYQNGNYSGKNQEQPQKIQ